MAVVIARYSSLDAASYWRISLMASSAMVSSEASSGMREAIML